MTILKYPVIPITLFFAIGILAGYHTALPFISIAIASSATFTLVITAYIIARKHLMQKPYFAVAAALFSLCAGMLAYNLHYAPNQDTHYTHLINDNYTLVIKGTVSERLKHNAYYEKYYFDISSVNKKYAGGRILVSVPKDSVKQFLHAGDVLIIVDNFKPINGSLNPYQFDYGEYMAKQNIFHQLTLKNNFIKAGQIKDFNFHVDNFRNTLINSFEQHNFSLDVMNVIKALLLGQRQDMDKEIKDNYTDAGVVHILAISGLHIAILFYIINFLLRPLSRFKQKGKVMQLIAVLCFLWMFAVISGLSASVVRSVVMFSFVSIGLYFNRNTNIFNSIAISMLVLLLAKPNFLFDVGFQLSYAAVFSIVLLQPLYKRVRISKYKAVNYFADVVVISLVAQLGVLPLSLYYFNQFPLLFPIANLVVIPLSTCVLAVGITVLALNFIHPMLAFWPGKLLEILIKAMNGFIQWIASFDSLVVKDISFTLLLNILLYAVITFMVMLLYKKNFNRMAALLVAVIVFQIAYIATDYTAIQTQELVVFNNRNSTLIAIKDSNAITIVSNDSTAINNTAIAAYNKGNFNRAVYNKPLENMLWFKNKKIMVLDSLAVYKSTMQPDILLLTQSAKVNLQRLISELKPKLVIADATNYKTYTELWKATCEKEKIPFHATAEKGFYILK